ncbi:MAG: fused MFS/spermidine synthase, partial [Pseudomonadota bacterium]
MSTSEAITGTPSNRAVFVAVTFTLTIFLSASLLFFVQPLFAKIVLPLIGGAPAVWTTAMLFFQLVLIAGYVYAHVLTRYVPVKLQLPIHVLFWALALTFLPLSAAENWTYDPTASITWQTLQLFAIGVGVPFALLSANAPLLQAWYVRSDGYSAHDPYFLYGASNVGSLLALLAFPLLAEPFLGARQISLTWAGGFVALGGFLILSGMQAHKPRIAVDAAREDIARTGAPTLRQIGIWMFIAFVPSSLMLTITTKVSADLGALPLIWVIPLALYILSFVVAFSPRQLVHKRHLRIAAIAALAACAFLMSGNIIAWYAPVIAVVFAPALFIIAVQAHRVLYDRRPDAAHLTVFYIAMSVGGALGGVFNSLLAPIVFSAIYEGYVTLVLVGVMLVLSGPGIVTKRTLSLALLVALAGFFAFEVLLRGVGLSMSAGLLLVVTGGFALALSALHRSPVAVLVAVTLFFGLDLAKKPNTNLFQDRSFFGAHTVVDQGATRAYVNGTTMHGTQRLSEFGARPTPLSYYYPESPMAQVLDSEFGADADNIGVVGLGVGSLACYAQPGQTWDFYEIDEMVDRVARDPALFSFMSECVPGSETFLGDARVVLAQRQVEYDVLYLDAYSSDSIPMHLLTREALQLYQDRITPDGALVFHITNRYYDLSKPLARLAGDLGLHAARQTDHVEEAAIGHTSIVVVMTADKGRFDTLLSDGRWTALASDGRAPWTDDFANP